MTQELLLRASALKGKEALHALDQVISIPHKNKFLPLVYYNLAICQNLKTFAHFDELRQSYLATYAKNRYLLNSVREPLSQFLSAGIPVIALKGFAYLNLYYKDLGARPITDIDILVPETHFYKAAHILHRLGWKTFRCRRLAHYNPRVSHALDYFSEEGYNIDLHCHVLHTNCGPNADADYWAAAESFSWNGLSLQTLCPTDHLIHTCAHGQISNSSHSLYWILDALCLLQQPIDWQRLFFQTEKKMISLFLLQAFEEINRLLPANISDSVIASLRSLPVSSLDRRIHRLLQTQEKFLSYQQYLICNAYRNCQKKTYLSCFVEYLKLIGSTDRLSRVPFKVMAKIMKKIMLWVKKSLSI